MQNIELSKKQQFILAIIFFIIIVILFVFISNSRDDFSSKPNLALDQDYVKLALNDGNFISSSKLNVRSNDIILGNKDAKLTIFVYEDLSNYMSADFNETISETLDFFGDNVRIVLRPYVDRSYPDSIPVNLYAECAKETGNFLETRETLLLEAQEENIDINSLELSLLSSDMASHEISQCFMEERYVDRLQEYRDEASSLGVDGTPTIFVNEEIIKGARPFEDIVNSSGQRLGGMKNIVLRHLNR